MYIFEYVSLKKLYMWCCSFYVMLYLAGKLDYFDSQDNASSYNMNM